MREVSIIGAGMVRFGKYDGRPDHLAYKNHEGLGVEACKAALEHAGVNHRKVEAAYAGQTATAQIQLCQRVTVTLGISGIPMYNHENACATSFAAFRQAYLDVANGVHDLVLVFGAEKMSGGRSGGANPAHGGRTRAGGDVVADGRDVTPDDRHPGRRVLDHVCQS